MTENATHNAALVAQPGWFAHRFDPDRDLYHLIPASRHDLRAATFLTDVNLPSVAQAVPAARGAAVAAAIGDPPLHFLFHSAFCCSTLLARALDGDGVALSLKEPVVLNDVIGWRGRGAPSARAAEALDHSLRVLVQCAGPGETVLIKPSNLFNPLAPAALALRPRAHALLLYAPLRTFLASIASKGLEGRLWVRDLWSKLLGLGADPFGFQSEELFRHTDLQVAALAWLAQHRAFAELALRYPDRVSTMSSATLLASPARALAAAAHHYGLALDQAAVHRIASGPNFTRHAKTGDTFDVQAREGLHRAAAEANADEIDKVERWALLVADSVRLPLDLPNPLLP